MSGTVPAGRPVGDAGPVVLGVGLESRVEGEGRGKRFEDGFVLELHGQLEVDDGLPVDRVGEVVAQHRQVDVGDAVLHRAAPFDQDVGAAVGVVHPPHLHEGQPHLGHRPPGARLLRSGGAGDRHLPVADGDAERGTLHRSDRDTRVLIRAEGARVDECDVGGVGVVVDDCGGAGVVADHSDLDAVEPGVLELGDGRDRSRRLRLQGDPGHAMRLDRGQHLQTRRRGQRRPRLQLRDLDHRTVGSELPAVVRAHEPAVGDGALGQLSPAMRASIHSRAQPSVRRTPQHDLRAQQRPGRGCRSNLPGESHGVPTPPQPGRPADRQHPVAGLGHRIRRSRHETA